MKKRIVKAFLSLTLLLVNNASATHLAGGFLTYTCTGNNKVVFTLRLYRDCNGITLSTSPQNILSNSGVSISAAFQYSRALNTDICYDSTNYACGTSNNAGNLEEYVYQSPPVSLNGIPPSTGWTFYWTACCRPSTISNLSSSGSSSFAISTTILPFYPPGSATASSWTGACLDSSPDFLETPHRLVASSSQTTIPSFVYQADNDSLMAEFAAVKTGSSPPFSSVGYATGFSGTSPLPLGTGSSYVIDPKTGTISLISAITGTFSVGIDFKSYRDGQLISVVRVDLPITIITSNTPTGLCTSTAQPTLPDIFITPDTTLNRSTALSPSTLVALDSLIYRSTILVGDTFSVFIEGSDYAVNPDCSSQEVGVEVRSENLMDTSGICNSTSCLEVISQNSNGSNISVSNSKVKLFWVPDNSQYLASLQGKNFDIFIKVRDNWCPLPNARYRVIKVNIVDPVPQLPLVSSHCVNPIGNGFEIEWTPNIDTGEGFQGYIIRREDTATGTVTYLDTLTDWNSSSYIDTVQSVPSQFGYAVDVIGTVGTVRQAPSLFFPLHLISASSTMAQTTSLSWSTPHPELNKFLVTGVSQGKSFTVQIDTASQFINPVFACADSTTYEVQTLNGCTSNSVTVYEVDTLGPDRTEVYWVSIDSSNYPEIYFDLVENAIGYALLEKLNIGQYNYIDTITFPPSFQQAIIDSSVSYVSTSSNPTSGSISYLIQPYDSCGNAIQIDTSLAFASLFLSVQKSTSNGTMTFSLNSLPVSVNPASMTLYERHVLTSITTNLGNFTNGSITVPIPNDSLYKQYYAFGAGVGKNALDLQSNTVTFTNTIGLDQKDYAIILYPNPASSRAVLRGLKEGSLITVRNALNQTVYQRKVMETEHFIDISLWPKGIYSITISQNSQSNRILLLTKI